MAHCKQDMPPPGGYEPLTWTRIPIKPGLPSFVKLGLLFGFCSGSYMIFKYTKHQINLEKIEMRCSRLALQPLIWAETDRNILKQLKKNRDVEEELMKDVPGWEVGKWKHYPIYLTVGPDEYYPPLSKEYFAHADPAIFTKYYKYGAKN